MNVVVKAFATFREVMDTTIGIALPQGATIQTLLAELVSRYQGLDGMLFDSDGTLKKFINILKNGRNIHFLAGLETPLDEGDVIALFPPLAGG